MNEAITITGTEVLSNNWYVLRKITFEQKKRDGSHHTYTREAYDRGNGATILLYNPERSSVLLTRQFRLPTYVNGNQTGMLIEACAGLLEKNDPYTCIQKEVEEETGYAISQTTKILEAYMSPGSVTELLYFFIATYTPRQRIADGGGVDEEDIEVLEVPFTQALSMIRSGEIKDGKTIILLQYAKLHGLFDPSPVAALAPTSHVEI